MSPSAEDAPHRLTAFVIIPARLRSTRLPGKLLLRETGKTLLQHTYEAAARARRPAGVCVATEDEEIFREVERFGGEAILTPAGFATGTDRIAAVAASPRFEGVDVIVNVQGDEPELAGEAIDRLIGLLVSNPGTPMATLAAPIRRREPLVDPACVKVVFDATGFALYFSRAAIPHAREWDDGMLSREPAAFHQHIGVYAYRRPFLLRLAQVPTSPLESLENLEQLRVLEHGEKIAVGVVSETPPGIDTPEDYRAFVSRQRSAR